jgi:hypothetical protein
LFDNERKNNIKIVSRHRPAKVKSINKTFVNKSQLKRMTLVSATSPTELAKELSALISLVKILNYQKDRLVHIITQLTLHGSFKALNQKPSYKKINATFVSIVSSPTSVLILIGFRKLLNAILNVSGKTLNLNAHSQEIMSKSENRLPSYGN